MTKTDIAKTAHLLGYSQERVMEFRRQLLAEKLLDHLLNYTVEDWVDDETGEIDWYGLTNHLGADVADILQTAREEGH